MAPDLSIIIPVYNRGPLIQHTLKSVQAARQDLTLEVIVIDDGSSIPLSEEIAGLDLGEFKIFRQENRGLLFARLAGLEHARGRHVLFLDSDDLVHPDKFIRQLSAMAEDRADVSYSDEGSVSLNAQWNSTPAVKVHELPVAASAAELFISIQPAPHNPIFQTNYLRTQLRSAWIPPLAAFNPVAEIWFYYLCSIAPARVVKVPGVYTLQGIHETTRLSDHWERLGIAALAVQALFATNCPATPATLTARSLMGEQLFRAWRKLPSGMPPSYGHYLREVAHRLPTPPLARLGGSGFQFLARGLGRWRAASLLRRRQRPAYSKIRTIAPQTLETMIAELPALP
jgi:hypothetical protein